MTQQQVAEPCRQATEVAGLKIAAQCRKIIATLMLCRGSNCKDGGLPQSAGRARVAAEWKAAERMLTAGGMTYGALSNAENTTIRGIHSDIGFGSTKALTMRPLARKSATTRMAHGAALNSPGTFLPGMPGILPGMRPCRTRMPPMMKAMMPPMAAMMLKRLEDCLTSEV